jgi:hypothetical protein
MSSIPMETLFYVLEAIAALLVLGVIFFIYKQMKKGRHQRHAQKVIESLGIKYLHNAVFPDGVDGLVFIDYLLFSPSGFIVLDVEHVEGHLFGGETVDQWSQVVNNKTYKFNNPLYANQQKCQAIIWNLEQQTDADGIKPKLESQTHGWVTFTNAGDFPKGIPKQVCMIDELTENLNKLIVTQQPVNEALINAWVTLQDIAISTRAENAR